MVKPEENMKSVQTEETRVTVVDNGKFNSKTRIFWNKYQKYDRKLNLVTLKYMSVIPPLNGFIFSVTQAL